MTELCEYIGIPRVVKPPSIAMGRGMAAGGSAPHPQRLKIFTIRGNPSTSVISAIEVNRAI